MFWKRKQSDLVPSADSEGNAVGGRSAAVAIDLHAQLASMRTEIEDLQAELAATRADFTAQIRQLREQRQAHLGAPLTGGQSAGGAAGPSLNRVPQSDAQVNSPVPHGGLQPSVSVAPSIPDQADQPVASEDTVALPSDIWERRRDAAVKRAEALMATWAGRATEAAEGVRGANLPEGVRSEVRAQLEKLSKNVPLFQLQRLFTGSTVLGANEQTLVRLEEEGERLWAAFLAREVEGTEHDNAQAFEPGVDLLSNQSKPAGVSAALDLTATGGSAWQAEFKVLTASIESLASYCGERVASLFGMPASGSEGEILRDEIKRHFARLRYQASQLLRFEPKTTTTAKLKDLGEQARELRRQADEAFLQACKALYEHRLRKVEDALARDGVVLLRKRRQLVRKDEFGDPVHRDWFEFVNDYVVRRLEFTWDGSAHDFLLEFLEDVENYANKTESGASLLHVDVSQLAPTDYEALCAARLEAQGWNCGVTAASGDQGVDVIATKDGMSVVLQCKLYTRPVGNAAVQEVIAGREMYGASWAAVVSNASYTASAKELANTTQVGLLHHDDLLDFNKVLRARF